jgi:hypothetical protein
MPRVGRLRRAAAGTYYFVRKFFEAKESLTDD